MDEDTLEPSSGFVELRANLQKMSSILFEGPATTTAAPGRCRIGHFGHCRANGMPADKILRQAKKEAARYRTAQV